MVLDDQEILDARALFAEALASALASTSDDRAIPTAI